MATSKNDITGDSIKSKLPNKAYSDGWDMIFNKKAAKVKRAAKLKRKNNEKILVSNGKSLVIKTTTSFYRYPLQKTPLSLILDKKYLIKKINNLNAKIIDRSFINYTIIENNNEINVFFDNKTFDLIGWQTKDIYQNLSITLLSAIQINQKISNNVFKLPLQN